MIRLIVREEHNTGSGSMYDCALLPTDGGDDCPTGKATLYLTRPDRANLLREGGVYDVSFQEVTPGVPGNSEPHREEVGSEPGPSGSDPGGGDAPSEPGGQEGEPSIETSEGPPVELDS